MIYEDVKDMIPSDHANQSTSRDMLKELHQSGKIAKQPKILDLGCGVGASRDFITKLIPEASWTGVDIESSPEVNARNEIRTDMLTFNGVNLPFQDQSFDLIYCHQVLEHVRHVEPLLNEVHRCLRKGGIFTGQTSQFEPYHSFSYWNFTLHGFINIAKDARLEVFSLRPGIDGFTLMERSYQGRPPSFSKWFDQESPKNVEIQEAAFEQGRNKRIANFRKLQFCGQFIFSCRAL